jgi:hypothetical protein
VNRKPRGRTLKLTRCIRSRPRRRCAEDHGYFNDVLVMELVTDSARDPASNCRVGAPVVHAILANWSRHESSIPGKMKSESKPLLPVVPSKFPLMTVPASEGRGAKGALRAQLIVGRRQRLEIGGWLRDVSARSPKRNPPLITNTPCNHGVITPLAIPPWLEIVRTPCSACARM